MKELDLSLNDLLLIRKALEVIHQIDGLDFTDTERDRAVDILEKLQEEDYEELEF